MNMSCFRFVTVLAKPVEVLEGDTICSTEDHNRDHAITLSTWPWIKADLVLTMSVELTMR